MAYDKNGRDGAPPREVHVERKTNVLAWLLLGAGALALLFALSQCADRDPAPMTGADPVDTEAVAPAPVTPSTTAMTGDEASLSAFGPYLAGSGTLPRTFVFEQVQFDTGSSEVRASDRAEIGAVAAALASRPDARIRLVGYADALGSAQANASLGKARAESVKAALVADGVGATRIETTSGGEANPADTNTTTQGRSENRRTELVLLQR